MNRTWSQAMALVRKNAQLLAIIAGVFLLLPALVFALLVPSTFDLMRMGETSGEISQQMQAMLGPLLIYWLIGTILQLIGYGAMVALIGEDRPTVGEAIMLGIRSLPTIIGATLLFILAYAALGVALSLVISLLGALAGGTVMTLLVFVLVGALVAVVLYVVTRLLLTLPVVVLEGVRNPVTALKRAWRLTKPHGPAIFGFYMLLFIAYFVINLLLVGVFSVIALALGTGPAAALFTGLINGLLSALVAMVMSGILVSMHQQLAGRSRTLPGQTFG